MHEIYERKTPFPTIFDKEHFRWLSNTKKMLEPHRSVGRIGIFTPELVSGPALLKLVLKISENSCTFADKCLLHPLNP
jgi:hypothetical protein